jgi:hypothetical protein
MSEYIIYRLYVGIGVSMPFSNRSHQNISNASFTLASVGTVCFFGIHSQIQPVFTSPLSLAVSELKLYELFHFNNSFKMYQSFVCMFLLLLNWTAEFLRNCCGNGYSPYLSLLERSNYAFWAQCYKNFFVRNVRVFVIS